MVTPTDRWCFSDPNLILGHFVPVRKTTATTVSGEDLRQIVSSNPTLLDKSFQRVFLPLICRTTRSSSRSHYIKLYFEIGYPRLRDLYASADTFGGADKSLEAAEWVNSCRKSSGNRVFSIGTFSG